MSKNPKRRQKLKRAESQTKQRQSKRKLLVITICLIVGLSATGVMVGRWIASTPNAAIPSPTPTPGGAQSLRKEFV